MGSLLRRLWSFIQSGLTHIEFLGFTTRLGDDGAVEVKVRYLTVFGKAETPWLSEDEAKAIYRTIVK